LRWLSVNKKNFFRNLALNVCRATGTLRKSEEFDPKTSKTLFVFVISQFIVQVFLMIPPILLYRYKTANALLILYVCSVAIYNSGNYYIERPADMIKRYQIEEDEPLPPSLSLPNNNSNISNYDDNNSNNGNNNSKNSNNSNNIEVNSNATDRSCSTSTLSPSSPQLSDIYTLNNCTVNGSNSCSVGSSVTSSSPLTSPNSSTPTVVRVLYIND
jgi:hypothetical protein